MVAWLLVTGLALAFLMQGKERVPEELGPTVQSEAVVNSQVVDAVGAIEHLPLATRRAFEYTSSFSPIPAAGPDDWRSVHPERAQTVLDYVQQRPNRPEAPHDTIYILPIGPLPAERGPTVDELAEYGKHFFGLAVVVLPPTSLEEIDLPSRIQDGTRQLDARVVLDLLKVRLPRDAYCLIAVTFEDLYPSEDFNYVFGMARLHERVGVFSFARYHPAFFGETFDGDRRLVVRRALEVMSHEIGHMFGLEHCVHLHCNMNGVNHLAELDRAPMHLCPVCLRKLHIVVGISPSERYGGLAEFYAGLGLDAAAQWAEEREAFLRQADAG